MAWLKLPAAGLRRSVVLTVLVSVLVPALGFLLVESYLTQKTAQVLLEQAKHSSIRLAAAALVEPVWTVNEDAIEEILQAVKQLQVVRAVRLEPLSPGVRAFEVKSPQVGALPYQPPYAVGELAHMQVPVVRAGQELAVLHLWLDVSVLSEALSRRDLLNLLLVAMQVIICLVVLMSVLGRRVLTPIERLKVQATTLLNLDAPMSHQVWTRPDEIGELGRHLTHVQRRLKQLFGELEGKNAQLQQLALYDQLTGLPNRSLFNDLVQRELLAVKRSGHQFGLLFVDLDRFKTINDSLGHQAGDALLQEMSRRLKSAVREMDVVCRQSGDEFLVLLREVHDWAEMAEVAQRILRLAEAPVTLDGKSVQISCSIGIAVHPMDGDDFETLARHADLAMYESKGMGRARYCFFHADLNLRLQTNLQLVEELKVGIHQGQMVLHYQPQLDAKTGAVVGAEALVRWQHPERGLVYPDRFIAVAEESGLIADLGRWCLHSACMQFAQWQRQGLGLQRIAVNVSALEFRDHRLLDALRAALAASGLEPQQLEIEVTETTLMADTDTTQHIIDQLHAIGVTIAVDDFGTGYSSLAYLRRLQPHVLKIDRSFVRDLGSAKDSGPVVRGIVGLAHALDMTVVAEGVETSAQSEALTAMGCETLQGYRMSRPLTVDAFAVWYRSWSLAALPLPEVEALPAAHPKDTP